MQLEHTKDLRAVQTILGHRNLQSTFWYLDHDLRQVSRSTLELLKRPSAERDTHLACEPLYSLNLSSSTRKPHRHAIAPALPPAPSPIATTNGTTPTTSPKRKASPSPKRSARPQSPTS